MSALVGQVNKNCSSGKNEKVIIKRRKKIEVRKGEKSDIELINDYLKNNTVKILPPGYAMNSLRCTVLGIDEA